MEYTLYQKEKKMTKIKFTRYNSEYSKKLSPNWRSPRGIHNKVRLKKKGHIRSPSIGFGSPKEKMNLYQSKFDYKLINSESDLNNLDKKYVIISSKLGLKNKLKILDKLKTLDIKIINVKDIEKFINEIKQKLKSKKEKKKLEKTKKEEIKKKLEEKVTKEKETKELTKEEKQEKEELDKRKLLEKPK